MEKVVDLAEWLARRNPEDRSDPELERLEAAIGRLAPLAGRSTNRDGRLYAQLQTELLAILGAVNAGLLEEAGRRAERLADRLAKRPPAAGAR